MLKYILKKSALSVRFSLERNQTTVLSVEQNLLIETTECVYFYSNFVISITLLLLTDFFIEHL